jgi:hypothetical protein
LISFLATRKPNVNKLKTFLVLLFVLLEFDSGLGYLNVLGVINFLLIFTNNIGLKVYYVLELLGLMIIKRTLFLSGVVGYDVISPVIIILLLFLEYDCTRQGDTSNNYTSIESYTRQDDTSMFSRLTFEWMSPLMKKGNEKVLGMVFLLNTG